MKRNFGAQRCSSGDAPSMEPAWWSHHPAFPYSDRDRRTRKVKVTTPHHDRLLSCDNRRPVMLRSSAWPACMEPYLPAGTLPLGPPPARSLDGCRIGTTTPEWLARVNSRVWSRDRRPDVNEEQVARARISSPVRELELRERAIRKEEEIQGSVGREMMQNPYVGFFLQRPVAKKSTRDLLLPKARRQAEAEFQVRRAREIKAETAQINGTVRYMQAIGLIPLGEAPAAPSSAPLSMPSSPRRYAAGGLLGEVEAEALHADAEGDGVADGREQLRGSARAQMAELGYNPQLHVSPRGSSAGSRSSRPFSACSSRSPLSRPTSAAQPQPGHRLAPTGN